MISLQHFNSIVLLPRNATQAYYITVI